jgi:hypothetical protein
MREPAGPQSNGTGPDNHRAPRHPADDLAWLEGVLQQLQHMWADHDDDPRWAPLQVTHEAGALAGTRARDLLRLAGAGRSGMGIRLEPFPRSGDGASSERGMSAIYGQRAVSRAWLGACLSPPPGTWEQPAAVLAGAGVCRLEAAAAGVSPPVGGARACTGQP